MRMSMRASLILVAALLARPALAGPQDAWTIDQRVSSLAFSVTQVGSIVSGRFPDWTGEIVLDPSAIAAARIDIRIDTRPVTANNTDVDSLLKGPNFLFVQKFPEARFVSTSVVPKGGNRYEAQGKLTIREITRDTVLPFTLTISDDPPGRARFAQTLADASCLSGSTTASARPSGPARARSPTK